MNRRSFYTTSGLYFESKKSLLYILVLNNVIKLFKFWNNMLRVSGQKKTLQKVENIKKKRTYKSRTHN